MNKLIERFFNETTGYIDSQVSDLFQTFFNGVVSAIEDEMQKKRALDTATQGVSDECITERLKELTNQFQEESNNISVFTEKEIRDKFDRYYTEYLEINNSFSDIDIDSEEVFKRFMIYVNSYVEGFTKKMSFFEKRALESMNQANDKLDSILRGRQYFERVSQENTKLLRELLRNKDEPVINVSDAQEIAINEFNYKYTFANNAFGFFDDEFDFTEPYDYYVISLSLQNIGRCNIESIEISDFQLIYCKEIYDDGDPRNDYYILPASIHSEKIANTLNILPICNQKVHLIIKKDEKKANDYDEDSVNSYLYEDEPFDFNNMQMIFKIKCNGEIKSNTYEVTMLISRNDSDDGNDITGKWQVNYSSIKPIASL